MSKKQNTPAPDTYLEELVAVKLFRDNDHYREMRDLLGMPHLK